MEKHMLGSTSRSNGLRLEIPLSTCVLTPCPISPAMEVGSPEKPHCKRDVIGVSKSLNENEHWYMKLVTFSQNLVPLHGIRIHRISSRERCNSFFQSRRETRLLLGEIRYSRTSGWIARVPNSIVLSSIRSEGTSLFKEESTELHCLSYFYSILLLKLYTLWYTLLI